MVNLEVTICDLKLGWYSSSTDDVYQMAFDEIYLALAQLAIKQKDTKLKKAIGYKL